MKAEGLEQGKGKGDSKEGCGSWGLPCKMSLSLGPHGGNMSLSSFTPKFFVMISEVWRQGSPS